VSKNRIVAGDDLAYVLAREDAAMALGKRGQIRDLGIERWRDWSVAGSIGPVTG
jgi:hypothetical protein